MNNRGFAERARLGKSRWYGGGLITFLATGEQTQGQFALFEATVRRGEEVPFHTHSREDESFYVLAGEMTCHIGDQMFSARSGDFLFLPRNIKHSWKAESETLTFLVLITPAGFEQSFLEFSKPAGSLTLPPVSEAGPPEEFMQRLIQRENELGVVYDFQRE